MEQVTKTNKPVNKTDTTKGNVKAPQAQAPQAQAPASKPTRSISEIKSMISTLQGELANALRYEKENKDLIVKALASQQDKIRAILLAAGVTGSVSIGADGSVTIPESTTGRGRKVGSGNGSTRDRTGYHLSKAEYDKIVETGNPMLYGATKGIEYALITTGQVGKDQTITNEPILATLGNAVNGNQISGVSTKWRGGAREIVLASLGMSVD